ncbi:MAG: (2Fe-2S)-binding protein [Gammaproteobacteria bacterium]
MSMTTKPLRLTINAEDVGPMDVPEDLMMIDFLHEYVNLTGSRLGCGIGQCRACTIIVDDPSGTSTELQTCITPAHFFAGKRIRTVEGHATRAADGTITKLTPIQEKFLEHYSFQCSYCTPGMINGATVLLERLQRDPVPEDQIDQVIEDAMNSHLCRCTGYVRYYTAIKEVVLSTPGLTRPA